MQSLALRLRKTGSLTALGGISIQPFVNTQETKELSKAILHLLGHNDEKSKTMLFQCKLYRPLRFIGLSKMPPWRGGKAFQTDNDDQNDVPNGDQPPNPDQPRIKTIPKAGRPKEQHKADDEPKAKKRRTENMQPNLKHGTMGKTSPTCNEICFRITCRGECPIIHCRDKKPYIVPGTPYTKIAKISCRSCRKTYAITNMT